MSRLERLLNLVNLFKVRDKITLNELIDECGVSKRTIYRDLETLSKMNVPIKYDNGYHLAGQVSLPTFNFTDEEKELIGCSLKCSPLRRFPRFRDSIKGIERKILVTTGTTKRESLNSYLFGVLDETDIFTVDESFIIECFIKSLESGKPLELSLKNGKSLTGMIPKSLNIRKTGWDLAFYKEGDGTIYFISLCEISMLESVRISRELAVAL